MSIYELLFGADTKTKQSGAQFMSRSRRRKLFSRRNKGFTINGKEDGKVSLDQASKNCALLSVSGSGKTKGLLIPSLLTLDNESSTVVMDTGEAFKATKDYLLHQGFDVKMIHLENPTHPDSLQFNPLELMNSVSDAHRVAQSLIDVSYQGKSSDPFWQLGAQNILELIIKRLCFSTQTQYEKNLQSVLFIVRQIEIVTAAKGKLPLDERKLAEFFIEGATKEDIQQYQALVGTQSPKTLASLLATAKNALSALNNPDIQHASRQNTLDFESLRKRPTVLFVLFKESNVDFYAFYLSLFFQSLFSILMEEKKARENYNFVTVFMEEAGMYKVNQLPKIISVLRKKYCSILLIFQELQQIKTLYGADYKTIMSNCSTKLVLGGITDTETLVWLEKMIGNKITENENGMIRKEPLLSGNEIRQLEKEVLCIYGKEDPVILPFTLYVNNKKLQKKCRLS